MIRFIKTTAIGGLLVIVPIAIVVFVFIQIYVGLMSLSRQVMDALGITVNDAIVLIGIVVFLLIALCFLTGLLIQTRLGTILRGWFDRNIGSRIPMYNAISSLTKRFVGLEGSSFAPVEVDLYGTDARVLGFLIEKLPDGRCAVYLPTSPVATIGNVVVIESSGVYPVDASVADMLTVISQWGVDASDLYPGAGK